MDIKDKIKELRNNRDKNDISGGIEDKDIDYYYKKYLLLLKNNYFEKTDTKDKILRLDANLVKSSLANTMQVTYEVTEACNLRCHYCGYGKYYNDYDKREIKNLSINKAKFILNYLLELWNSPLNMSHNKEISIGFYGGEPLLNFSFIKEIVEYVKKLRAIHNFFGFSMTTNGIPLEKHMDFIVENNFNLLISLDGNEKNNAYRTYANGKPAFKNIYKNCVALRKKYPDYFEKNVNFNAVLHNKNSILEIYQFFKENFGKTPFISEVNPVGIKPEFVEEFKKTYKNYPESFQEGVKCSEIDKEMFLGNPEITLARDIIFSLSGYVFKDYPHLLSLKKYKYMPTGTCLPFSRKIFITAKGKILPCERIGHQYSMGHVDEDRIEIDFQKIAERYNSYFDKLQKKCNLCYNRQICQECIFTLNIEEDNPRCDGSTNYNQFATLLARAITYLEKNPLSYSKIMKEMIVI